MLHDNALTHDAGCQDPCVITPAHPAAPKLTCACMTDTRMRNSRRQHTSTVVAAGGDGGRRAHVCTYQVTHPLCNPGAPTPTPIVQASLASGQRPRQLRSRKRRTRRTTSRWLPRRPAAVSSGSAQSRCRSVHKVVPVAESVVPPCTQACVCQGMCHVRLWRRSASAVCCSCFA